MASGAREAGWIVASLPARAARSASSPSTYGPALVLGIAAGTAARPRFEIALLLLVALATVGSIRPALQRFPPAW